MKRRARRADERRDRGAFVYINQFVYPAIITVIGATIYRQTDDNGAIRSTIMHSVGRSQLFVGEFPFAVSPIVPGSHGDSWSYVSNYYLPHRGA